MTEASNNLAERPQDAERDTAPEPATPRALWPTFMRRTLAEESLRPLMRPEPPRRPRE
ncbi:hypothetical protein [Falsiroseomonas sp.]|uniref:hypothetical protein n=1 Tax=Falsiroseomonas sp. TaxID=2870721 RepID=UPI00356950B6